jgi:O-antigen/teichoic acid export membrane protein
VLCGVVLWLVAARGPAAYGSLWLLAFGAPIVLLAPNLQGLWLGEGRMVPMASLAISPALLSFATLCLLGAWVPLSLELVLASWVASKVVVGLALLIVLWRGQRLGRPDFTALRLELPFVFTIGLTNLIGLLNYRVGLFVVEHQLGLQATGVYSIAMVVAELLWFVSGSLTQAAYGRIGVRERAQAASTTLRVVHLGVTVLLVAAPVLWLVAALVVPSVLGSAYADSLVPLAVLLPGALLFGGASALSAYFTNHAGAPSVPAWAAFGSMVANAGLSFVLVPRMGMSGAALAASMCYAGSVMVVAWRFARHAKLPLIRVFLPSTQVLDDLRTLFHRTRASA